MAYGHGFAFAVEEEHMLVAFLCFYDRGVAPANNIKGSGLDNIIL